MVALGRGHIKRAVLEALEQRPLWTLRDMATATGLTRNQVRRALHYLRRIGVVTSGWCLVSGSDISNLRSTRDGV